MKKRYEIKDRELANSNIIYTAYDTILKENIHFGIIFEEFFACLKNGFPITNKSDFNYLEYLFENEERDMLKND